MTRAMTAKISECADDVASQLLREGCTASQYRSLMTWREMLETEIREAVDEFLASLA